MHELTVDKRGGRQGFTPAVMAELMFLGHLHDVFKRKGHHLPEVPNTWKNVPVPNPSPQGFRQAIERGQMDIIEAFLGAGVKADYRFEAAQTPLMVAAINGQFGSVCCLIDDGAGVNLRDERDFTALHWAAYFGHSTIARVLIGADAKIDCKQNRGDTPLSLAVIRGHLSVARLLLARQADPNISSKQGLPLTIASSRKDQNMVALLTQFGAHA